MSTVRPFKAIRPDKKYVEEMASLPYDVMNREEAACMADGKPHSFLRISRAEIDMPGVDAYDQSVYDKARSELLRFMEDGALVRDHKPMFYIYRQVMNGRIQTGIVACVSVDEYNDGIIKKHEFTRTEKEIDRINHFKTCKANTEPIFLTYRSEDEIDEILNSIVNSKFPEYDFVAADGVQHALWTIDDDVLVSRISACFERVDNLYIADGHHRSASAAKVGEYFRNEASGNDACGSAEYDYFMAVIFPSRDLKVFDYNRVVRDLNGLTADEFKKKVVDAGFELKALDGMFEFSEKHVLGMFLEGRWYEMRATLQIVPDDLIAALDVSILQDNVLAPILGIHDPRTDKRIDFVGGIRGFEELEKRVGEDMAVAFAVPPVSVDDLLAVADAGQVMPPKSTWFEPKLASGLFIHSLCD